jgi:hypothetical protein
MKRTILLTILAALFTSLIAQYPGGNDPYRTGGNGHGYDDDDYYGDNHRHHPNQRTKRVQLALILDASGSMNGLINQAKSQFWGILNELSYSYDGAFPLVEVAIYDYGSKFASRHDGYVRRLVPLTADLDWAADKLYDIRTGGRYEYAGLAIQTAVNGLRWDPGHDVDKIIFIAGNETLDQGRTDIRWAIRNAANRGITVHTIYCGEYNDGVRHGWADAAYMGGGMYTALEQDAWDNNRYYPQDNDLWSYNARLNDTYIPYGQYGRDRWDRQRRQDRNAYDYGRRFAAQRAMYKASRGYRCPDWDLVDAVIIGRINLREVPANDLPPEMRSMTIAQRQAYIERKAQERQNIRSKMKQLADARQETVQREERRAITAAPSRANGMLKSQPQKATSLNQAIRQSVGKKMTTKPVAVESASEATSASRYSTTTPRVVTPGTSTRTTSTSASRNTNTRPSTNATSPRSSSVNRSNNTRMNSSSTRTSTGTYPRSSTTVKRSTTTRTSPSATSTDRTNVRPSSSSASRSTSTRSSSSRFTPAETRNVTPPKPRATTPRPSPKPAPKASPSPSRRVVSPQTLRSTGTSKTDTKSKPSPSRSTRSVFIRKN